MSPLVFLPLLGLQDAPFKAEVFSRLAMTPVIDGSIESEEWDHLADYRGMRSFMQWQPGMVYFAGDVPNGYAARVVLSQLGGQEAPKELIITPEANGPEVLIRNYDATSKTWVKSEGPKERVQVAVNRDELRWRFELAFLGDSENAFSNGAEYFVRVEPFGPGAFESTLTDMAPVRLSMDRSFNLTSGVEWTPQIPYRSVAPGDRQTLRFNFRHDGKWQPERVEMRAVGRQGKYLPQIVLPFPVSDSKNRAFVDYPVSIREDAPIGYTVVNVRVSGPGMEPFTIQSCIEVSPQLDTRISGSRLFPQADGTTRALVDLTVRSNTSQGYRGKVFVESSGGWNLQKGQESNILLYHARGSKKVRLDLRGPSTSKIIPIVVRVQVGDKVFSKVHFVRLK